jgi:hypothetical protein
LRLESTAITPSAPYPSPDRGFHVIKAPSLSGNAEAAGYLVQGRFRERGFRLQQNAILDIDHHQRRILHGFILAESDGS